MLSVLTGSKNHGRKEGGFFLKKGGGEKILLINFYLFDIIPSQLFLAWFEKKFYFFFNFWKENSCLETVNILSRKVDEKNQNG